MNKRRIQLSDFETKSLSLNELERHLWEAAHIITGPIDASDPIGVAKWEKQITDSLPDEFKSSLPAIEKIEQELDRQSRIPDEDQ